MSYPKIISERKEMQTSRRAPTSIQKVEETLRVGQVPASSSDIVDTAARQKTMMTRS
jgi:hypothetical protein